MLHVLVPVYLIFSNATCKRRMHVHVGLTSKPLTIYIEYIYYLHVDSGCFDIHLTHRLNKPQIYRGLKFCHLIKAAYCKNLTVGVNI